MDEQQSAESSAPGTAEKSGKKRVPKGSTPPFLSLDESIKITKAFYERAGGEGNNDILSSITGNSSSSSTFGKKISALRAYGLVIVKNDLIYITEIGRKTVAPISQQEQYDAYQKSFLQIYQFRLIYEKYKGKYLAQDEFLVNMLTDISDAFRIEWIKSFKSGAKFCGLLESRSGGTYLRETVLINPENNASVQDQNPLEANGDNENPNPSGKIILPPILPPIIKDNNLQDTGHRTKISLSGNKFAEFIIPDKLSERDATKLKGALQGLVGIIGSMIEDAE